MSYIDETGQAAALGLAVLQAERKDWAAQQALVGKETTDQAFEDALRAIMNRNPRQALARKAKALLSLQSCISGKEDREEYQRILFGGNTTDEVSSHHPNEEGGH